MGVDCVGESQGGDRGGGSIMGESERKVGLRSRGGDEVGSGGGGKVRAWQSWL